MAGAAARGGVVWSASPAGSVTVRARRAEWARVSGVGLVMAVQAFGWSWVELLRQVRRGRRPAPVVPTAIKTALVQMHGASALSTAGECAQVSTRSDRFDDMGQA
ncbi:hypothetical protein TPA0907_41070 [Micromonospora humidisoli]|nr:hypothetical protein TPA0907_41070 [Micromonospora sp. AKA109]